MNPVPVYPYICAVCSVVWSCLTLCNPIDCSSQAHLSMGFPRQEWAVVDFQLQYRFLNPVWTPHTGVGYHVPPGDFPNPGIELRSPTVQAVSLLSEKPGKTKSTGMSSLPLLQAIFPIRNWAMIWIAGGFFTGWATREVLLRDIFRSQFCEPNSCIFSYLKKYQNPSWWWLFLMTSKHQETSRNLLEKYVREYKYSPFMKNHVSTDLPCLFGAVSQSYLKCLLGCSLHFAPYKI